MRGEREESEGESPAKRRLEAVASLVGAALAVATLAIILWDGIRGDDVPPVISVERGALHQHENGFVLEISAMNTGNRAAAQVLVEGELRRGPEIVETSEATLDYVPSRSRKAGGLFFTDDPRQFELVLRAKGYMAP